MERAQRLLRAASDVPLPEKAGGGNLRLSMGLATTRATDKETADVVLDRADKALYVAKEKGKGRIVTAERKSSGEPSAC
jgi:PleD family two-component response regulator